MSTDAGAVKAEEGAEADAARSARQAGKGACAAPRPPPSTSSRCTAWGTEGDRDARAARSPPLHNAA